MIARSSEEAEFRALAHGINRGIWIRRLFEELRFTQTISMHIHCNNKAAISIFHNPILHDKTNHIEGDEHFIKEKVDAGVVCIPYLPTIEQIANMVAKDLPKWQFNKSIGSPFFLSCLEI